jgi:hypothetical protein
MDPERWQQVERLYHAALEREPGEQARFLAEACFGDEELRREVEVLLQQGAGPTFTQLSGSTRAQLAAGSQLGQYRTLRKLAIVRRSSRRFRRRSPRIARNSFPFGTHADLGIHHPTFGNCPCLIG